ncbi:eabf1fba-97c6-4249-a7e1-7352aaf46086 [Sclerotinia trifoliorum]|uniref:Eabf1fba-97c6-4249-a7e1-7352aaf46086 n=1 Tax=Sclerotinia trifoliorum TaxID=28548 RepID=A0A8H2VUC9_9HELO|nr:eabf1fba-97c6-4249-a7e1-7352aaf46086 [Sclerotinia trifoliorum]
MSAPLPTEREMAIRRVFDPPYFVTHIIELINKAIHMKDILVMGLLFLAYQKGFIGYYDIRLFQEPFEECGKRKGYGISGKRYHDHHTPPPAAPSPPAAPPPLPDLDLPPPATGGVPVVRPAHEQALPPTVPPAAAAAVGATPQFPPRFEFGREGGGNGDEAGNLDESDDEIESDEVGSDATESDEFGSDEARPVEIESDEAGVSEAGNPIDGGGDEIESDKAGNFADGGGDEIESDEKMRDIDDGDIGATTHGDDDTIADRAGKNPADDGSIENEYKRPEDGYEDGQEIEKI